MSGLAMSPEVFCRRWPRRIVEQSALQAGWAAVERIRQHARALAALTEGEFALVLDDVDDPARKALLIRRRDRELARQAGVDLAREDRRAARGG